MNENQLGSVESRPKRLALRCSAHESALFAQAVEHLGTTLSTWMRAVVNGLVAEATDPAKRVAMQARFHLHQAGLKSFGPAKAMLNARAPDVVVESFLAVMEDRNLSHALRWALYEAAQVALAGPSKAAQAASYQRLQQQVLAAEPAAGPEVSTLDDGFPTEDIE